MDEPPLYIILKLLAVFALVLSNGFFVAAEFALVTIRRQRLEGLAESGRRSAQAALRLSQNPLIFISVAQFGVTLSSLVIGFVGEHTFALVFNRILLSFQLGPITDKLSFYLVTPLAFAILTFLHVVIGEITPKTAALERNEKVALFAAIPIELIYKLFFPFIWLLNQSGQLLIRSLGMKSTLEHTMAYTEEEIRHLVSASHQQGHLIAEEQEMIHNVFEFTDMVVCEVMVPRPQIVAIEVSASPAELTKTLESSGYSRLPVYKDNLDNIIGTIHTKDIFAYLLRHEKVDLSQLVRKPLFVPDSAQLVEVLHQMRRFHTQLAIVVNEHGGVEGVVSMEDLLEEIVGEIRDEHDFDEVNLFHEEADGSIVMDGALSIREANRKLSLNLPESDDYTTIAGFLMAKAGKLLSQGEKIEYQNTIFTIEKVDQRRVLRVRIPKLLSQSSSVGTPHLN